MARLRHRQPLQAARAAIHGDKARIVFDAPQRAITPGQAAVKALQAGADLLLMPNGLADAYTAVLEAVQDGTIPQQRLDESVQRILQCKYQYGILTQ